MAFWNGTTETSGVFAHDYIYDFNSLGAFNLTAHLNVGFEQMNLPFGGGGCNNGQLNFINTTQYPGNSATNGSVQSTSCGYAILADTVGNGTGIIANWTNLFAADGSKITRIAINIGTSSSNKGSLSGPYPMSWAYPGTYHPTFILYRRQYGAWQGSTMNDGVSFTPTAPYPAVTSCGLKSFTFSVFQKAWARTKRNNGTGASLDNATISDMDTITNNVITLDKSANIGDNVKADWQILKLDAGLWSPATSGVDYSLGTGDTLASSNITITWNSPGSYRVINTAVGLSSVSSGSNDDDSYTEFTIGQSIIDTITLPTITSILAPVSSYDNTVISTNPLTGITSFEFTVTSVVNTEAASWIQQVDADPPVELTLSDASWRAELTAKCNVRCKVKRGAVTVASRTGFGPHTFSLTPGTYTAGFEITPKVTSVITLGQSVVAVPFIL